MSNFNKISAQELEVNTLNIDSIDITDLTVDQLQVDNTLNVTNSITTTDLTVTNNLNALNLDLEEVTINNLTVENNLDVIGTATATNLSVDVDADVAGNLTVDGVTTSGNTLTSSADVYPLEIKNAITSRGPSGFSGGCGIKFYSALDNVTGNEDVAEIVASDRNGADNARNAVLQFRVRDNTNGLTTNLPCVMYNDKVDIPLTTASTSSTTGALTVAGGVGVAGNLNCAGTVFFNKLIQGTDDTTLSDVALELESNMNDGDIKRFTIGKNSGNNGDNFIFAYEYSTTEANRECRLGLYGIPAMKFQTTQTLFEGLPVNINDDVTLGGSVNYSTSTPSVSGNVTLNSSSKFIQFIASSVNIDVNLPDATVNPGLAFKIYNNSAGAQTFNIKNSGGVSVGAVLSPTEVAEVISNGVAWVRTTQSFTT